MSLFDKALREIEKGMLGLNEGLDHGFPKLMPFLPNIQQSTYYILGGEQGTGKSALADDMFLFNPFETLKANLESPFKMDVTYFSFEIDPVRKILKAICRRIYKQFGIIVDLNYIMGKGKHRVPAEIYNRVLELRRYFEELEDILTIYSMSTNPTGIHKILTKKALDNGSVSVDIKTNEKLYTPKDPNLFKMVIIDHVGLSKKESNYSKKENIDTLSKYLVNNRNWYGYTNVILSQLNRSISSTDRAKIERIRPQMSDFKDTGDLGEDCDTAMILFSPHRYDINQYAGYNISKLGDRFRGLSFLKNRDGKGDTIAGLGFVGEVGTFLPLNHNMPEEHYNILLKSINDKKIKMTV